MSFPKFTKTTQNNFQTQNSPQTKQQITTSKQTNNKLPHQNKPSNASKNSKWDKYLNLDFRDTSWQHNFLCFCNALLIFWLNKVYKLKKKSSSRTKQSFGNFSNSLRKEITSENALLPSLFRTLFSTTTKTSDHIKLWINSMNS